MGKFIDLTGKKFGRLTVIERASGYVSPGGYHRSRWRCVCDCGNETVVGSRELSSGDTRSCGCYGRESKSARATTHGLSGTQLYQVWIGIKARCYNKNHKNFMDYGGRGICMCDEWRSDFMSFYNWAQQNGFEPGLTVERKDVNGNYCPENCCFVTRVAQASNRRNSILLSYHGESHPLAWWAEHTGIKYSTLYHRVKVGIGVESALSLPVLS